MPGAAPKERKRRKSVTEVVTHEAIKTELAWLNLGLYGAQRELPEPVHQAKTDERERIVPEGVMLAGLGALVYLREHEQHRTIRSHNVWSDQIPSQHAEQFQAPGLGQQDQR